MKKDKVLITGASGYIGKTVFKFLLKVDLYDVYILSRECLSHDYPKCLSFEQLAEINFDYIINCIGETKDNELMNSVNNTLCKEIFTELNMDNIKKFIHFSTVSVYDQSVIGPIDFKSRINLDSEYARTKFAFDEFLLSQYQYLDKIIIVRPSNVTQEYLPSNSIFRLSALGFRFISFRDRYINWVPLEFICNNLLPLMTNQKTKNIYLFNKFESLNNFYKVHVRKKYLLYIPIPVELIKFVLVILKSQKQMQKYNQLFSKYYFI